VEREEEGVGSLLWLSFIMKRDLQLFIYMTYIVSHHVTNS